MSIFGIIGIGFAISSVLFGIALAIIVSSDCSFGLASIIAAVVGVILWIAIVFVGIGLNTENEKVFIQEYLAKKQTIEISLQSESLTGYERVQLVNNAVELNGELAKKKATFNLWHFVVYDNTIYDGVEPIDLSGGSQ